MAKDDPSTPLITDNGNQILDAVFAEGSSHHHRSDAFIAELLHAGVMANPAKLHDFLKLMTGVVDVSMPSALGFWPA